MSIPRFKIVRTPADDLAETNKAILNPGEAFFLNPEVLVEHIAVRYPNKEAAFVFSVLKSKTISRGDIAFNAIGRKWAGLMVDQVIEAAPYKFMPQSQCLNTITFEVEFNNRANAALNLEFNTDDMARQFSQLYTNQAFTLGQIIGYTIPTPKKKVVLELKVKEMEAVNVEQPDEVGTSKVEIGLSTANTIILFERAEGSEVRLTGSKTAQLSAPQLFTQNWDFGSMGIGGLSEQFNKIFRRAFASRLLPPDYAASINRKHVKGILLYGPPGTGKTLIARQIGKMLLAREPKIVNGPEVLNKFVGESEANIRRLFAEAEEEQAKAGIHSGLHMIIFDEIDAICKSRSSSASGSGTGDNVVNQLLTKIDGVNSLNNVLLIGMTNRRDLIDEALLRPGRLEVQIEIGIPNEEGRLEIFKIHTEKLRQNDILDPSIDLEELAAVTKNYTGAEIAGLIEAAQSLAENRVIKADGKITIDKELLASIKITRDDFKYAMEHDVKPALGASEDQLKQLAGPIIHWDSAIDEIRRNMTGTIRQLSGSEVEERRPYYVLLIGESGAGRTTLAANMAMETQFPFIRVYQAKDTAAKSESSKVQYMEKLFNDACRSELSCIVMDGLEVILDYCHIGPRWSNTSRNLLETMKDIILPKNNRMLVICTCKNEQFLNDLLLADIFDEIIRIPSLTKPEHVSVVLEQLLETGDSMFTPSQIKELVQKLGSIPFQMGISKLERLIKNAARDEPEERVKMFVERIYRMKLVARPSRLDQPFGF